MGTIARYKNGDLLINNDINEKLPAITNGLVANYPLDGNTKKYIPGQIRYVRDWVGISTASNSHIWYELEVIDYNDNNVALSKTATADTSATSALVTDGDKNTANYWNTIIDTNVHYITVDLGELCNIKKIIVYHYSGDARTFHNTKTEVSEDGVAWFSIFDSAIEGEYAETSAGHIIDLTNLGTTCVPTANANTTLNFSGISIEEPTTNLTTNQTLTGWTGSTFTQTLVSGGIWDGWYRVDITRIGTGNHICYIPYILCSMNTTYTFSIEYYNPNNDININIDGNSGFGPMTNILGTNKYTSTVTIGGVAASQNIWFYHKTLTDVACNTFFYFRNAQSELKSVATSYINGTRSNAKLQYSIPTLTDFTIVGSKRHLLDTQDINYTVTKSGTTFSFYKNGLADNSYKNKWVGYAVRGAYTGNKTGDINVYNGPINRFYQNDFVQNNTFYNYSLASNNNGYLFRTFVYASAATTVWHRYIADNAGSIRVNNGTFQNLGGWIDPAVNSSNPDVRIDLVAGWNVIEICYMDFDTGGALVLVRNSQGSNLTGVQTGAGFVDSIPLSSVPEVLYMTAELPIEMSSNNIYFNEKSNCFIHDLAIYNRALNSNEVLRVARNSLDVAPDGSLITPKVTERTINMPNDVYYYPLTYDAKTDNGAFNCVTNSNTVFANGAMWIGGSYTNLFTHNNPSTFTVNAGKALEIIDYSSNNIVYRNKFTGELWNYKGYDIAVTAGVTYNYSIDIFVSPDFNGNYSTMANIEVTGSTSFVYDMNNKGKWQTFKYSYTPATSGNSRVLMYPASNNTTATQGYVLYRNLQIVALPYLPQFCLNVSKVGELTFNLNSSIGLDWNSNWSIVYWKMPMGTESSNQTSGFLLDSLGCGGTPSNTVGGGYVWWGKTNASNSIDSSTPSAFNIGDFYGKWHMISLVKNGTTLTIKTWDMNGQIYVRTLAMGTVASNYFVTQFGFDLSLNAYYYSGTGPQGVANCYYRDLIVSKRAFTDAELLSLSQTLFSSSPSKLVIQNKLIENTILS